MRLRKFIYLPILFLLFYLFTLLDKIAKINNQINAAVNKIEKSGIENYKKDFHIKSVLNGKVKLKNLSTIYVVTPTYQRASQMAELTRLQNTLRSVPKLVWILIEDSKNKNDYIRNFLNDSKLKHVHLNKQTTYVHLTKSDLAKNYRHHRGSHQRNLALQWIRNENSLIKSNDVVYFADDDNSYMLRLFDQMRDTKKVSIWPVAFVGRLMYEKPKCVNNHVIGWFAYNFSIHRRYSTDLASFCVNAQHLRERPQAKFPDISMGNFETLFLEDLVKLDEFETKSCRKLMVWHTQTVKLKMRYQNDNLKFLK